MRTWYFCAASEEEKSNWIEAISNVIKGTHQNKKVLQIEEKLRLNSYNIPAEELEWSEDKLGKGSSGVVKKALWLGTTEVAVKLLNSLPEFIEDHEISSFYKEIEILRYAFNQS
jgi:hypothetical protein